jgi:mono/diheme cytochrome c family protein
MIFTRNRGLSLVMALLGALGVSGEALADGPGLFTSSGCTACHGADGGGTAMAPNLTDNCFINGGSQEEIEAVIRDGSPNNPMMMAYAPQLGDNLSVVAQYVHSLAGSNVAGGQPCQGTEGAASAAPTPTLEVADAGEAAPEAEEDPTPAPQASAAPAGDVQRGGALFAGTESFENGGPSCASCHSVDSAEFSGGGSLAVNLSESQMGKMGQVTPFLLGVPAMITAFDGHELESDELADIQAFLVDAGANPVPAPEVGKRLATTGFIGAGFLMGIYSMMWGKRRKRSVNQDIYDRQTKSSDL